MTRENYLSFPIQNYRISINVINVHLILVNFRSCVTASGRSLNKTDHCCRILISPIIRHYAHHFNTPFRDTLYDRGRRRRRETQSAQERSIDGGSASMPEAESSGIVLANQAGRIYMRFMAFRLLVSSVPSVPSASASPFPPISSRGAAFDRYVHTR